jgi:hypothetical protein
VFLHVILVVNLIIEMFILSRMPQIYIHTHTHNTHSKPLGELNCGCQQEPPTPPVSPGYEPCDICGPTRNVTNPNGLIDRYTCAQAEEMGKQGFFTENQCDGFVVSVELSNGFQITHARKSAAPATNHKETVILTQPLPPNCVLHI